jgi:hypothetical protein
MYNPNNTETWSLHRDDPVEHVRTITTAPGQRHYECSVCKGRIWTRCDNALEEFLNDHDECIN